MTGGVCGPFISAGFALPQVSGDLIGGAFGQRDARSRQRIILNGVCAGSSDIRERGKFPTGTRSEKFESSRTTRMRIGEITRAELINGNKVLAQTTAWKSI